MLSLNPVLAFIYKSVLSSLCVVLLKLPKICLANVKCSKPSILIMFLGHFNGLILMLNTGVTCEYILKSRK